MRKISTAVRLAITFSLSFTFASATVAISAPTSVKISGVTPVITGSHPFGAKPPSVVQLPNVLAPVGFMRNA